ncbi:ABC transporter permease [Halopiger djelfimassiliensis]|uniref:ABC transporter permease n=1 Tax=Halopiger djelfimassiliensis TaxID=1293047 RepID=UPI000677C8D9|nr:ABC transporter permease [Halopiger djelfimassiliensis]
MSVRRAIGRASAVVGIAFAQLRRSPGRTVLSILAVALAVLSVTLLASLGVGVVEQGEDGIETAGRDIWISRDPVDPSASGTANPIADAHGVTREITSREDVPFASPIAMHEVYVGTASDDLERTAAVGVHETHGGYDFEDGRGFEQAASPADGARPTEPTTGELVLDPRLAAALDVSVGDTVYLGSSRETAPEAEFTVVGISAHHSQYLGSEAVTMPLADLQAVVGTTGTDRATFITASVADDADPDAVRDDLDEAYPEYDVRTSDEQVTAMFEERPIVLASGATLIGLAVVGGIVLTVNLFVLVAAQQRTELAALRALGLSRWVLAGTVGAQGLLIGLLGGLVGLAATPPLATGLDRFAASVVGFDGLLRTSPAVYAAGFALAIGVGTIVAVVTGWRAGRYARIEHLER